MDCSTQIFSVLSVFSSKIFLEINLVSQFIKPVDRRLSSDQNNNYICAFSCKIFEPNIDPCGTPKRLSFCILGCKWNLIFSSRLTTETAIISLYLVFIIDSYSLFCSNLSFVILSLKNMSYVQIIPDFQPLNFSNHLL